MAITIQSTYDFEERPFSPGTLANGGKHSTASATAYGQVQVGVPCFTYGWSTGGRVTDRGMLSPPSAKFLGVSIADQSNNTWDSLNSGDQGYPTYAEGSTVSILTAGPIWVVAAVPVQDGDAAYVEQVAGPARFTNVAVGPRVGTFRSAGGSGARVKLVVAKAQA